MVEAPFIIGTPLFLYEQNQEGIYAIILTIEQVSLIIMPILVTKTASKIGNLTLAKWAIFGLLICFVLMFFTNLMIYVLFFIFPFFMRIFNNSLTPYINMNSNQEEKQIIFAVRDVFLYIGVATGLFLSSLLTISGLTFLNITKMMTIVLLIELVILILLKDKTSIKKSKPAKNNKFLSFPWKDIKHKKRLFIFILIDIGVIWIGTAISYLPLYATKIGYNTSWIYTAYSISYFLIPFLAVFTTHITTSTSRKKWYLFDLSFDVIPLIMIIFSSNYVNLLFISIVFISFKDFVKPISLTYFFDCFDREESNSVWGMSASVGALISLPFPFILLLIFNYSSIFIFLISVIIAITITIIAYFNLPGYQKENNFSS